MNESDKPIGLIGIGLIGAALAERLLHAGYQVLGYDLLPERRMELQRLGGNAASSVPEVFPSCRRILLSLPDSDATRKVLHENAVNLGKDSILIDTTTGEFGSAVELGEWLETYQADYLDATISGSSQQVRQGETVVMVGGSQTVFEACRDIFQTFSRRAFYLGSYGAGMKMKLVSNLVLGINRAAVAEGLAFARSIGLDLRETLSVLRESMAYSRIMDTKGEKMIEGDFSPQARLSQHHKDVRLILEAGCLHHANLPLSVTHHQILEEAEAMGLGDLDNSAIFNVYIKNQDKK